MGRAEDLVRLLAGAPPRSAELVKRFASGQPIEAIASEYQVEVAAAKVMVLRALLDVSSGGTERVPDDAEPALVASLFDRPGRTEPLGAFLAAHVEGEPPLARRLLTLLADFRAHATEVDVQWKAAAEAYEKSPDRARDEWLRRIAIAVVIALTAYFYWRESNKPVRFEKRPVVEQPAVIPAG